MEKPGLDIERERLLDQVFAARTLAEIAAAKQLLRDWLADHPDELGMADAFEVLSHQEDFARSQLEAPGNPSTNGLDPDSERERLLGQVFAARTLAEIAAAKQLLRDWLADHPNELGMADAFEVLSHQEESARAHGVGSDTPAYPATTT